VGFVEGIDHLGINNDGIVDNEIGDEDTNKLAVVMNGVLLLLIADKALLGEFDDLSSLVELFIQTGPELVEHIHGCSDDDFSELVVVGEHGIRLSPTAMVDNPKWENGNEPRMTRMGTDQERCMTSFRAFCV